MTVKSQIRSYLRKFGIEISRYNTSQSHTARIGAQLVSNKVDCVLDVGANDGGYAKFVREAGFKGNIVSFEPQADAYKRLLIKSKDDANWHVSTRMALGDAEAELEINIAGNSTSSSLLSMLPSHVESAPHSKNIGKEKVAVHRLDALNNEVIKAAKRIYIKIDTQGYEMPVLLGAKGLMDKVVGVQLEMSVIPLYNGQVLYQELFNWLEKAGFDMWGLESGFMNQETGRMLQFDGIFYRSGA
jgi:FkbM family methyltransferase